MDLHAADVKLLCSDRWTRRKTLCSDMMMIHYDPKVQAAIISQRINRPAHIAAEEIIIVRSAHAQDES